MCANRTPPAGFGHHCDLLGRADHQRLDGPDARNAPQDTYGDGRDWTFKTSEQRYIALAREASTSGDRVASENLYQHAEHYFRVMNAANEGHQHRATRPTAADLQTEMSQEEGFEMVGPSRASPSDRQPYSS